MKTAFDTIGDLIERTATPAALEASRKRFATIDRLIAYGKKSGYRSLIVKAATFEDLDRMARIGGI